MISPSNKKIWLLVNKILVAFYGKCIFYSISFINISDNILLVYYIVSITIVYGYIKYGDNKFVINKTKAESI